MATIEHDAFLLPIALVLGCAPVGTRPTDMGASEHEQAAQHETKEAQAHDEQFDPNAWSSGGGSCDFFCFDTWSNPTMEHAREARTHRQVASKHRRASKKLREVEERECSGIPERDRDISPFFHFRDIVGVELGSEGSAEGEFVVRFAPIRGVDAKGMQRLLDCHLARNAVRGHDAPEMDYCPLVPRGVEASASGGEEGLEVRLTARDVSSQQEVRSRLRKLKARAGTATEG